MTSLLTANAALLYFLKYLKSAGENVKEVRSFNKDRHFLITCHAGYETQKLYYLVYHKDFFMTFNQQFPAFVAEFPQYAGVAESINKEWLELAVSYTKPLPDWAVEPDVKLVFIYPEGRMYWTDPRLFKKFAEAQKLVRTQEKVNLENREDYSGRQQPINETTYSLPVKMLKPLEFKNYKKQEEAMITEKQRTL